MTYKVLLIDDEPGRWKDFSYGWTGNVSGTKYAGFAATVWMACR